VCKERNGSGIGTKGSSLIYPYDPVITHHLLRNETVLKRRIVNGSSLTLTQGTVFTHHPVVN